jgi:uncharacterized protein YndB with AHSA1/START domain
MSSINPLDTWSLDREIVLSTVLEAPREAVFAAYADPAQIEAWYAPEGFSVATHEADIRPGGRWRFRMTGPDGTAYENRMVFRVLDAPGLIVFDHGVDADEDPGLFRVTVTFDAQDDGRTVLTARQLHPNPAQRRAVIGFGGVAYGYQTLAKLAEHLARR